jgi:hypothetical protein
MSSTSIVALSVLARITKRARISIGYPIGHRTDPLRVAEQLAMVDVISRCRLDMAFVTGVPYEFACSNQNAVGVMNRFWEAHDFIIKAMTSPEGLFNWESGNFHYRQVNIWPRPDQTPHPPVWSTTSSRGNARVLGERGYVMSVLGCGYSVRPGIGGTLRENSSSELALKLALAETERPGADVDMIVGRAFGLPPYEPTRALAPENAVRPLEDGLIVAAGRSVASSAPMVSKRSGRRSPICVRSFTRCACAAGTRPTQSRSVPRTDRSARNRIWLTRNSANNCGLLPAKSCNSRQWGSIRRPGLDAIYKSPVRCGI